MKRSLWLLMLFLLAGHVPAASADSACEGRFVNPITDICWSCIFPLSLGSIKVSQGKVPDTANPSMPIQICPAPPPLFRRIGLAIGYWEPMALTDVTRSPGCMVNLGFSLPAFGKTAQGTAKKDEKQVNGAFYHVHWYKYPLTYWLNIITSLGCLEGGDLDIAYLSEIDPTWTDSSLTTILNPEAVIFANPIAQGACAADAIASAFNMPIDTLFWCAGSPSHKIAEFAAGEIGEKEHLKASEQYSYGADPVRDGVSTGKDMERQTLVSYSDIQSLPDLTCYVTLPGPYPAVKLSLKYQTRPKVAPEFIPRDINPEMENRLSAVLAAREAEGRQMASLFEPDVPEVVSGEDVTQAEQPQQPVSPAINDKKSDAGVNVPAGGIEQELKMKPEEEMEQQLPPGISESGEVVDMAVYEAWQREQNPDIQQKMQRREEVNINVHRERGEDVEPGDDF